MYVSVETIKRTARRIKSGAQVDGMGNRQTLEAQIEAERAKTRTGAEVMEEATGAMFKAKEQELRQSKTYISGIKRTLQRVAKILDKPDPRTWTRAEIMEKVFDPMLNDRDPFNPTAQPSEWSVLTITGIAVNIRRVAPQLNKPVEQGGLQGSYKRWNSLWSQTHNGRKWQPPRTWLKRTDYKEFHDALKEANDYQLPSLRGWTLGDVIQLAFDTQIVTGMRERYETLQLPFERINLPTDATELKSISDNISYVSAKKGETWENLPLRLFDDLCYKRLTEWFNHCKTHGVKPSERIFPISYEVYRNAIVRARKICKFDGANKITGHAGRRTHATWLRLAGASIDQIAGQEPHGWLGVGWKTRQTLSDHYMSYEAEEVDAVRELASRFNPLGKLTAQQEQLASRYETGRMTAEGKED
jgi:integrase